MPTHVRTHTVTPPMRTPSWFWRQSQTDHETGCWNWQRGKDKDGYGRLTYQGIRDAAHRTAWRIMYGPIGPGVYVLHHCDNPACINPEHLFLGSPLDNMRDKVNKSRQKGGAPPGERCGGAKLTEQAVREIRLIRASSGLSFATIGKAYGVGPTAVQKIVKRQSWRHIE